MFVWVKGMRRKPITVVGGGRMRDHWRSVSDDGLWPCFFLWVAVVAHADSLLLACVVLRVATAGWYSEYLKDSLAQWLPKGFFRRSHRMNMSFKAYGSPTREELRDTQVSVTAGMCHCKRPSGLPALCPALCFYHCVRLPPSQSCSPISFSDAKTPDAVLQTTPKQVQKVTLKREVNFFQNKLPWHFRCSLIPSPMTLPPKWDDTSLGDTFSSTFRLPGAWLAGCSARVGCCGHMYPALPRALEQGSKSLPSPVMLSGYTHRLDGLRKTTNCSALLCFKPGRGGEPGHGEISQDPGQASGIFTWLVGMQNNTCKKTVRVPGQAFSIPFIFITVMWTVMGFIYLCLLECSLQFSSAIEVHVFVRPYSEELSPLPQHKANSTINQAISVQSSVL